MARIPVVTRDRISEKEKHHERLQHVGAATLQRLTLLPDQPAVAAGLDTG
jgi:hypothetical protein